MQLRKSTVLLISMVISGCGSSSNESGVVTVPAKGKILVDSKSFAGLKIQLDKVPYPHAVTDDKGEFVLETIQPGDGAPTGDYEVSITSPTNEGLGKISDPIGSRYADTSKSGLTAKIGDSETKIPDFQLKPNTVESRVQKSAAKKNN
jgi:hypothetical protein